MGTDFAAESGDEMLMAEADLSTEHCNWRRCSRVNATRSRAYDSHRGIPARDW